jgi:hypothetical protein
MKTSSPSGDEAHFVLPMSLEMQRPARMPKQGAHCSQQKVQQRQTCWNWWFLVSCSSQEFKKN